jgi:uncharacterized protein
MDFVTSAILLGLVGNLHCMGMCGPIAFVLPLNRTNGLIKIGGILVYNSGRILTYSLFGLLFGLFGAGLNIGAFQQYAAISFGIIILLWVYIPLISRSMSAPSSKLLRLQNFVKTNLGKRLRKNSLASLFSIGLLNGLLPCGLVYLAVAGSLATGNVLEGALFMTFFGLGTLPMMFVVPYFSNFVSINFRRKAQKVLPYFLTVMALAIILRGMNLGIPYLSPKYSEDKTEIISCCYPNTDCNDH